MKFTLLGCVNSVIFSTFNYTTFLSPPKETHIQEAFSDASANKGLCQRTPRVSAVNAQDGLQCRVFHSHSHVAYLCLSFSAFHFFFFII